MLTTKLSSRGQLVIPKQVRDAHQWSENTEFSVREKDDGIFLVPLPAKVKSRPLSALIGSLPNPKDNRKRKLSTRDLCAPVTDYAETTQAT
jgi:AbrB family looped-hinge helix DNA binding protein